MNRRSTPREFKVGDYVVKRGVGWLGEIIKLGECPNWIHVKWEHKRDSMICHAAELELLP